MIADLKKIWSIFTPGERRRASWMLVLVVLMAMAETGSVLSIMPFLSVLGRPEVIHENDLLLAIYRAFSFQSTRSFIIALGLASITFVLFSSVFKTITLHLVNRFVHLLRHSISSRLLSRYLHQPYEFFLSHNASELSRNVLSEVDQLLFSLIQPLSQLIAQGAVVAAILLLVFLYNPMTAVAIIVVVGMLYGVIYGLVRKRLIRIGAERQAANGQRFQSCTEALGGIKDVKVTHSAAAYEQKFNDASRLYSRHLATSDTLSQSPLYLVEAVGYSGLIVIALLLMMGSGDIAHVLPALGLYGFAAYRMLPSVQIMYRGFAKLKFSSAALAAINSDLALPDERTAAQPPLIPRGEICLQGVTYAYPAAPEKRVLNNVDLVIPAGSRVIISGRSGAGKSTLMDILLGLLRPQVGNLIVDGQLIDRQRIASWQATIGYVPQSIFLADTSIKANIAFGISADAMDMKKIERAARDAQIHNFIINELPDGYDTLVGDRGARLSGGQKQRIGIARALYRNPAVLLFDEATSALDLATESAMLEAVFDTTAGKTLIFITHKMIQEHKWDLRVTINDCTSSTELG